MITTQTMRRTSLLFAAIVVALVISSGVALAVTKSCEAGVECFGTRKGDTLNGSEGGDYIHGRGDTLEGLGGPDSLYGEGGADKLFGGMGLGILNHLVGGPGNDLLSGGDGLDHYYFGDGWGKDHITDGATSQNAVIFSKGPAPDEFVPTTADMTVKLVSGDGPEVKNASATSTINWEGSVIGHVTSGAGDDNITGNISDNTVVATLGGADTISTGGGDDTIHVDDGAPDDVVDCGENLIIIGSNTPDDDEVRYDPGDQIATSCETQTPVNP